MSADVSWSLRRAAAESIDRLILGAQTVEEAVDLPAVFCAQFRDAFGALCRLMPRPTKFNVFASGVGLRRGPVEYDLLKDAQAYARALADGGDWARVWIAAEGQANGERPVSWTIEVWK